MSNEKITLETFPSSRIEALTMLYLQNQDLSSITPEELVTKYNETYAKIKQQFSDERKKVNYSPLV